MRLTADFNVRGGIYTSIVAEHRQPGWQPATHQSACQSANGNEAELIPPGSGPDLADRSLRAARAMYNPAVYQALGTH